MNPMDKKLAQNIKRYRSLLGLTQREVGKRMLTATSGWVEGNTAANTMSKIEKAERRVTAAEFYELSVIFGCGMDDLMGVTEAPDPLAGRLRTAIEDAIESVMGGAA